ncbi:MAG: hypothetical protein F4X64_12095 [Chloroflexi bacterium]|nr:hypothetical protein [Chloroflexota bacterium]
MRSRRRSRYWHDPERLQGQAQRDAQLGRSEFYVYVLDTDFGDYVGHTWHVGRRLKQHQAGQVKSTAGSSPTLLWVSRPFATREDSARFEASLKSLRDQHANRYAEIVGHEAVPFIAPRRQFQPNQEETASLRPFPWAWALIGIVAISLIFVGICQSIQT